MLTSSSFRDSEFCAQVESDDALLFRQDGFSKMDIALVEKPLSCRDKMYWIPTYFSLEAVTHYQSRYVVAGKLGNCFWLHVLVVDTDCNFRHWHWLFQYQISKQGKHQNRLYADLNSARSQLFKSVIHSWSRHQYRWELHTGSRLTLHFWPWLTKVGLD